MLKNILIIFLLILIIKMSKSEEFMENFWKDMAEKGSYSYGSERVFN